MKLTTRREDRTTRLQLHRTIDRLRPLRATNALSVPVLLSLPPITAPPLLCRNGSVPGNTMGTLDVVAREEEAELCRSGARRGDLPPIPWLAGGDE